MIDDVTPAIISNERFVRAQVDQRRTADNVKAEARLLCIRRPPRRLFLLPGTLSCLRNSAAAWECHIETKKFVGFPYNITNTSFDCIQQAVKTST
jgi:hypothetical protein